MNLSRYRAPTASSQQGVFLLEALIAILIFSFGVLGLMGLQGAMVKSTTDSRSRSEANYLVQQRLGRIWTNPCNLPADGTVEAVPGLPNGQMRIEHFPKTDPGIDNRPDDSCGNNQFFQQTFVEVTWMLPGEGNPSLPRTDPSWRRVRQSASITGG